MSRLLLNNLLQIVEEQGIEVNLVPLYELEGYRNIGLPHDVNGCAYIQDRIINLYYSNLNTDAEGMMCCLIHEYGHIKGCTEIEELAWDIGIKSVPDYLIPNCIETYKQLCLEDYEER